MKPYRNILKKNKLLFILAGLLIYAWFVRLLISVSNGGSDRLYGFIAWNMFLATIPLLLEPVFRKINSTLEDTKRYVALLFTGGLWLLFLPNAFYILTDFMHLNPQVIVNERGNGFRSLAEYSRGDGLYVIDSLLVFAATAFGAFVGGVALYNAYRYLEANFKRISKAVIALVILASSVGVYIGRFGRWNSWDAVTSPWAIASELVDSLAVVNTREQFSNIVFAMVIFHFMSLFVISWLATMKGPKQR